MALRKIVVRKATWSEPQRPRPPKKADSPVWMPTRGFVIKRPKGY